MTEIASRCGLCGESTLLPLVTFDGIEVVRCGGCGCGLVRSIAQRDTHDYSDRYDAEYDERKAANCFRILEQAGVKAPGRVLDVGCGKGQFLDLARTAGFDTCGIELDAGAVSEAAAKGHQVLQGSASDAWDRSLSGDLVSFWDLLEHLDRPGDALSNAFNALNSGGRLIIATPFFGSAWDVWGRRMHRTSFGRLPQLVRMCWSEDHLFRFDPSGLSRTLVKLGFTDVDCRPVMLLSLTPDKYAGGAVLKSWTGVRWLDRAISKGGVSAAKRLNLSNKILVTARKP